MNPAPLTDTTRSNETRETSAALLALARQHGYLVSPTQLVRWHRTGLLPRPRQLPLTRARGTQAVYPPGTGEQLLLLCSLRSTERRLATLAWHLWLVGNPVDLRLIRAQLHQATLRLARWSSSFADFKQALYAGECTEKALRLLERYAAGKLESLPLRRIRKRVGRNRFPTFLRLLADLATEPDNQTAREYDARERRLDLRILALGLGLEKRFVEKPEALEYYLVQDLIPDLRWIFKRWQEVRWDELMDQASDFDLLQTRDELRTWLMRWATARQYRDRLPNDYPRWRSNAQEIFSSLTSANQAVVLVGWLALRSQAKA